MDANSLSNLGTECVVRIKLRRDRKLTGIVAAVGAKWALLHNIRDLDLDGMVAVRLNDIRKVSASHARDELVARSLRQRGLFPTPVSGTALDTTAELLVYLKRQRQFVAAFPEGRRPGSCHWGYITNVDATRKSFALMELTPAAMWDAEPTTWRFREIRRIQIDDEHLGALESLAGSPPAITLS